jgi:hypothetical protein
VATWSLGGTQTYTSTNTLSFTNFEQLDAAGTDRNTFDISGSQDVSLDALHGQFIFADGASISGSIRSTADSVIDWSAYQSPRHVILTQAGPTSFDGTEPSIGGGFTDIGHLIGGASFADSLTSQVAGGAWKLAPGAIFPGPVIRDHYQAGTGDLTFSGFEILSGPGVPSSTQTLLRASLRLGLKGQDQVVLAARVIPTNSITPTGWVQFYRGETWLATVRMVNGVARYVIATPSSGPNRFTAVYSGDTSHNISVGTAVLSVPLSASAGPGSGSPPPVSGLTAGPAGWGGLALAPASGPSAGGPNRLDGSRRGAAPATAAVRRGAGTPTGPGAGAHLVAAQAIDEVLDTTTDELTDPEDYGILALALLADSGLDSDGGRSDALPTTVATAGGPAVDAIRRKAHSE